MKKNKKLFIGLLLMSAFLGACASLFAPPNNLVKDIPPSLFEEKRSEGERLVYITVERADATERGMDPGAQTDLFIVTDNAAIERLTAPYASVIIAGVNRPSPSIQNSVHIFNRGLAVFSLPKSQENIGLSYFCSAPVKSEKVTTGVSATTQSINSTGHFNTKINPEAGDIAIRVILSPNSNVPPRTLASTSSSDIQQMVSGCHQYGSSNGTGTPGFIAFP